MYLNELGLHSKPFALAPDADLMVWTDALERMRTQISAAIGSGVPTIVLTGDVGAGKTTFLSALIADGLPRDTQIVFLRGSIAVGDDLLGFVADHLPRNPAGRGGAIDRIAAAARRVPALVVLDEAQGAAPDAVLALDRLARDGARLTVLLAGQPDLNPRLSAAEYHDLKVPRAHRYVLPLPTEEESRIYIARRLIAAGGAEDLITPAAATQISRAARRVPRLINKIADACLFLAVLDGRTCVDDDYARQVIQTELDPVTLALSPCDRRSGAMMSPVHPRPTTPVGTRSALDGPSEPDVGPPITHAHPVVHRTEGARSAGVAGRTAASRPSVRPKLQIVVPVAMTLAAMTVFAFLPGTMSGMREDLNQLTALREPGPEDDPPTALGPVVLASAPSIARLNEEGTIATDAVTTGMSAVDLERMPAPVLPDPPAAPAAFLRPRPTLDAATATEGAVADLFEIALSEDDPLRSAIFYARAGVLGHTRAARYIAQKYETGDGVTFSPEMAERWRAIATETDAGSVVLAADWEGVRPLSGERSDGRIDLVWDGLADTFEIELADAGGTILGRATTDLTALSVEAVPAATAWRVAVDGGEPTDWIPLAGTEGDGSR